MGKYFHTKISGTDVLIRIQKLTHKQRLTLLKKYVKKISVSGGDLDIADIVGSIVLDLCPDRPDYTAELTGCSLEELDLVIFSEIIMLYNEIALDIIHIMARVSEDNIDQALMVAPNNLVIKEFLDDHILFNKGKKKTQTQTQKKSKLYTLNQKGFKDLATKLKSQILGQDSQIDQLVGILKLPAAGIKGHVSVFMLGPTGVGKSETAKKLCEALYPDDKEALVKINCGELSKSHEYSRLVGSPPGYVGSEEKSFLRKKAELSNSYVFLFDEFEKAHHDLQDIILNLIDEGFIMDSKGRQLDFTKSIFLFTSNVGVDKLQRTKVGFSDKHKMEDSAFEEEMKKVFRLEFIKRLDRTIIYHQLKDVTVKKIIIQKLLNMFPMLVVTEELISYIQNKVNMEGGARELVHFIMQTVGIPVADKLIGTNTKTKLIPIIENNMLTLVTPRSKKAKLANFKSI